MKNFIMSSDIIMSDRDPKKPSPRSELDFCQSKMFQIHIKSHLPL